MAEKIMSYIVADDAVWVSRVRHGSPAEDGHLGISPEILTERFYDSIHEVICFVSYDLGYRTSQMRLSPKGSGVIARKLTDAEGWHATRDQIEKWKKGEIELYLHELTFYIYKICPADMSEMQITLKKDESSIEEWASSL